jgi:molecular chaperone IbpA
MNMPTRNHQFANAAVGFDRFFNSIAEITAGGNVNYPPYNIIKVDDENYRITIAAAGFGADDVEITHHGDKLIIKGKLPSIKDDDITFLHRGISNREFTRTFVLAENTTPQGAEFENGLLHVDLKHVIPEAQKPRKIEIRTS